MFPLRRRHSLSYHDAPRSFGAQREHGARTHAGCDLYALAGIPVLSVGFGQIVRDPYLFYDTVYAIEIAHPGVGLVRYGEVRAPVCGDPVLRGVVRRGQVIAQVGRMPDVAQAMVHFELYSRVEDRSPLTDRSRPPFQRRDDLVDPTSFLDQCELVQEDTVT